MKDSEILRRSQELIADVKGWCQGAMTVQASNTRTKHCAVGAHNSVRSGLLTAWDLGDASSGNYLIQAADAIIEESATDAVKKASFEAWTLTVKRPDGRRLPTPIFVNDQLGHGAVMEMFAMAIEMALEDELEPVSESVKEGDLVAV